MDRADRFVALRIVARGVGSVDSASELSTRCCRLRLIPTAADALGGETEAEPVSHGRSCGRRSRVATFPGMRRGRRPCTNRFEIRVARRRVRSLRGPRRRPRRRRCCVGVQAARGAPQRCQKPVCTRFTRSATAAAPSAAMRSNGWHDFVQALVAPPLLPTAPATDGSVAHAAAIFERVADRLAAVDADDDDKKKGVGRRRRRRRARRRGTPPAARRLRLASAPSAARGGARSGGAGRWMQLANIGAAGGARGVWRRRGGGDGARRRRGAPRVARRHRRRRAARRPNSTSTLS